MEVSDQYCVPPGFRFHPTEEELVGYYLKRKVESQKIDLDVIVDIDLYRMEPWDIEGRCKYGKQDEENNEWFFFSHKDRKYPTGKRTNRATAAGFWKATGRDKEVFSVSMDRIIGMRKTLVFYKGRAPNGTKTNWIMHEYRLQLSLPHPQEEGWVVCRAFKKPCPMQKQGFEAWTNYGYYHQNSSNFRPPSFQNTLNPQATNFPQFPLIGSDQSLSSNHFPLHNQVIDLPQIESPTVSTSLATNEDHDFENGIDFDCYKVWENMENILGSKSIEPTSFPYPTMPLIPTNNELDSKNQNISQFLGCFPDL